MKKGMKFQYLLVRLKDPADKNYEYLTAFQYLLVRLKVSPLRIKFKTLYISIPLGTIKRQGRSERAVKHKRYFNTSWYD